jgi:DNA-binding MarR family transcriptional regulator
MVPQKSDNIAALATEMRTFEAIDEVIHTKARLALVSVLAANRSLTFTELRDGLGLTDGNLAAHLRALKAAGMIRLRKVDATKPYTVFSLSGSGRAAFAKYLDSLERIVKRHRVR